MDDKERLRRAEGLVRLLETPEGRLLREDIEDRQNKAINALIFADADTIFAVQGTARAYVSILDSFDAAHKTLAAHAKRG